MSCLMRDVKSNTVENMIADKAQIVQIDETNFKSEALEPKQPVMVSRYGERGVRLWAGCGVPQSTRHV
jgi:hypothetical protein